jgi:hypothetical protein
MAAAKIPDLLVPIARTDADWAFDLVFSDEDWTGRAVSVTFARQGTPAEAFEATVGDGIDTPTSELAVALRIPATDWAARRPGVWSVQVRSVHGPATDDAAVFNLRLVKGLSQLLTAAAPAAPTVGDGIAAEGGVIVTRSGAVEVVRAGGAVGISAYQQAIKDGSFVGTAQEYAARPIVAAQLADDSREATDQVRAATDQVRTDTLAVKEATDEVRVATDQVRSQTAQVKQDTLDAKAATELATAAAQEVVTAGSQILTAAGVVHTDRTAVETLFATVFSSDDFASWALTMVDGFMRLSLGIKGDGSVAISKAIINALQVNSATFASLLATALTAPKITVGNAVAQSDTAAISPYVGVILDMVDRIAMGLRTDGVIHIDKLDVRALTSSALNLATAAIANLSATAATIDSLTQGISNTKTETLYSPLGGSYLVAALDLLNRVAAGLRADGTVRIEKLDVRTLTAAALNAPLGVQTVFQVLKLLVGTGQIEIFEDAAFANATFAIVDGGYRIGVGLRGNGDPIGKFLTGSSIPAGAVGNAQLADQAVSETKLQPDLARKAVPKVTDVVAVLPDDYRGKQGRVANRTELSGFGWSPFPRVLTRAMQGINDTATALQFRRRSQLLIRGRRYIGAFDPAASGPASQVSKGVFVTATSWPPAGTFVAGDYYEYGDAATRTIGSDTYARGDLAVYTGSAWARQAKPPSASGMVGDWWSVTSTGWWKGNSLAAGDFLFLHGIRAQGGPAYYDWGKGAPDQGEFFLRGEWSAAGALPSSPVNGDLYQVSGAGTQGGITFSVDDYLVRDDGVWGVVAGEPIYAVAAGSYGFMTCRTDSSEWEFRRTDKSASRVGISLKAMTQTAQRTTSDGVYGVGDSMIGLIGSALSTAFGTRSVTTESYGGGSFTDCLSMVQRNIRELGDPHKGKPTIAYAGQNAQSDFVQTEEQALRLIALLGARDPRFLFMTVLGQRIPTFASGRLVFGQFEDQKNDVLTNPIVRVREFYKRNIPDQWFDTRLTLLAQAGSTPDLQFPGFTEAQVASTYGAPPLSAWLDYSAAGIVPASMSFQGYRSADGLPSGGTANDYFLRSGGLAANGENSTNAVGNVIANIAGVWTELTFDKTHFFSSTIKTALGSALKAVFDAKGW